jgi:single-stranded DNA-binding protein
VHFYISLEVKDPELKQAGEMPVCNFVLAVDRNYKNSEGEV